MYDVINYVATARYNNKCENCVSSDIGYPALSCMYTCIILLKLNIMYMYLAWGPFGALFRICQCKACTALKLV